MRKILVILALITVLPLSALAQEPGSGGPVIEANISGNANIGSFNLLRCSGTDCARIGQFLFPGLVGVNPETGDFASAEQFPSTALALRWEISEDGKEYTFYMRDDAFWSDGSPITANDVKFSFDAIASGEIESDLSGYVDAFVQSVEVIDDYTVKFTFGEASCDALSLAGAVYPLPSQYFGGDFTKMVDPEFDRSPAVTGGIFNFGRFDGDQIVLTANPNAWGIINDVVIPEGFIYVDVPDTTVAVERLLSGEINFLDGPERQRRQELIDSPDVQTFEFPANGWNYIGLNLADPTNPQNGLDEDGNPIDQGHHPILGDVQVRRALQLAMNVQEMIDIVSLGQGVQMAANEIPSSWAISPDLQPIPHDPDAAAAMLDEAGWVLDDDGVRVCQGCEYAEEGTPLRFALLVPDGSVNAERIALLFQDQLKAVGVEVDVQILDFNTVVSQITGQTFDAVLLAWSNGYPVNPDVAQIFNASADVVGAGFNFTSYRNPDMEALNEQARVLPGCDPAERAALYWQVQETLQNDQPYLWLYTANDMYAARAEVEGFSPFANQPFWNVETWQIDQPR